MTMLSVGRTAGKGGYWPPFLKGLRKLSSQDFIRWPPLRLALGTLSVFLISSSLHSLPSPTVLDPRGQIRPWFPSSLAKDFGPLQRRNKREILRNILNCSPPCRMPGSATVLPLVLLYFSSQSMVNFLGSVWWPMFVIVFYVLSPFPTLVARRFSDGEERSSLLFEVCCFITTCIVLSSYGLPIVLARKLIVSFCFLFSLCCLCDIIPFFSIQFFSILFFSIIFFLLFYILFCQVRYHLFKDTHSNYLFVFYSLVLYL